MKLMNSLKEALVVRMISVKQGRMLVHEIIDA